MNFHIITLFKESFSSYLSESILGRAIKNKIIKIHFYNPRDFANNKFKHIDQRPYGGGPGMVLQAEPVAKAIEKAIKIIKIKNQKLEIKSKIENSKIKFKSKKGDNKFKIKIIFFSPSGKRFDTSYAKKLSKNYNDIVLICGRYEGIDARIKKIFKMDEVSIGDFVLTGGEIPAMVLIDCIGRQIKGFLGNFDSREEERISSSDVYTRPEVLEFNAKKYRVPKILLSGNHKKIDEWKEKSK